MKRLLSLLVVLTLALSMLAGCGKTSPSGSSAAEPEASVEQETAAPEAEAAPAEEPSAEEASAAEEAVEPETIDNTEANANLDFSAHQEMLKNLHTELPLVEEPVTLSYFFGFESSALNYIPGNDLSNQQIWKWLGENTGIQLDLTVVDGNSAGDKLNLMLASGTYTDLINLVSYTQGLETAYDQEIIVDVADRIDEYMPNYSTILHSDANLYREAQDGGMILGIYPVKDQVANPTDMGAFIRMDWLEDLGMEVPQTYDELEKVLEAFKSEKGASEPLALYNTVSMADGLLMGGFGSMAELSSNAMSTVLTGFYQVDGEVKYGAIQDGTRDFLSWLHKLNDKGLINFENLQNRVVNPFGDLTMTAAADGTNGYMYSNQPFGGNYSTVAAEQYGDTACNWWPVQDVGKTAGQTLPFFEEVTLLDNYATCVSISTQCENVEAALRFLDYGYSYEGSLLYNFGFQKGSGHDLETWDFDENGVPTFDQNVLLSVAEVTNMASAAVATKDLAGVVFDRRLAFEFGERENSCFDAWSTNKNNSQILGSATTLNAEESQEASSIYSDIITYVSTSVLQFINGDLDVDDDAVWNDYVAKIEAMNEDGLTAIVQGAYDRAHP